MRMLKELRRGMDDFNENVYKEIISIKKDIETIKKNQSEVKNVISKIKYTLERINSRLDKAEDQISNLENRIKVSTQSEYQKKGGFLKHLKSLRDLWYNIKCNKICIIGVPEGEESEQGLENLFEEIMVENFSKFMKEKVTQVQETQRGPIKMNPRHSIIKIAKVKDKERILKTARGKQLVAYKGAPIRLSDDFSTETLQVRKD